MDTPVPTVFISYSHAPKDEAWKDGLLEHLNVLAEDQGFSVWHDRRIGAGEDWNAEIEQAVASARVAVLLVSSAFLASRFIRREEVPRLLRRHEQGELTIVPVLVRACAWDDVAWLKRLQMRPSDARPLEAFASHEVDSHLTAIAKEIARLVRAAATAPKPLPARAPEPTLTPREHTDRVVETGAGPRANAGRQRSPQREEPLRRPDADPPAQPPRVLRPVGASSPTVEPPISTPRVLPQPTRPRSEARRHSPTKIAAATVVTLAVVVLVAMRLAGPLGLRHPPEASPTPAVTVTALPTPDPASLPAAPPGVSLAPISFQTVQMDARGAIVERRQGTTRGFSEDLGGGVKLDMIAIPGGKFPMGSPAKEPDRLPNEGPQVDVTVAPFFMGKFEVTQAQWRAVATKFDRVERDLTADPSIFKGADRPVEMVSWYDAVEFCKRVSKKIGRDYRLPSEAEWEYAARAGTQTPFAFGPTITPELVNYDGDNPYGSAAKGPYRKQTTKVGELGMPNAFGLFDVHGNVWEWVQDVWHDSYAGRPADGRAWENGGDSTRRVLRGGAWSINAWLCRSAVRSGSQPESRYNDWGFRVVCAVSRTQ